jgi:membrane fusion protein, multidrug efflux system
MKKKIIVAICIVALIFIGYKVVFKKKSLPPAQLSVPVTVGKAVTKDMPLELREIGTIEGYRSVPIYSRVVGTLIKIHFKEGQDVKQGQPLFTIDPNPYKEALRQAEAKLIQDTAQLKFAKDEAVRYKYLVERGAVSKSDYENKQTIADAQEAIVASDKAAVENARLNLSFCHINAPFEGRMGAYSVYEGRMIKDNDTQLALINQIMPVYATFSASEKDLPDIRTYSAQGRLKVTATPTNYKGPAPEGELTFIDNTVNTQTGMILLKATFPNKDKFLWPGQYVNVAVTFAIEKDKTVVPDRAVQLSQTGKYAFVVKPNNTVEYRTVVTERTQGGETIVAKGLSPGETVVTDGHLKLKDGFPVEIREALNSGHGKSNVGSGAPASPEKAKPIGGADNKQ